MPKTIESPVSKFAGTVILKDPIPLSACVEWEAALEECRPAPCPIGREILFGMVDESKKDEVIREYTLHFNECEKCRPGLPDTAAQERMLKAVKHCVEKWEVPGFDLQNPPGSPKMARSQFVAWLIREVSAIYTAEEPDGDPNA